MKMAQVLKQTLLWLLLMGSTAVWSHSFSGSQDVESNSPEESEETNPESCPAAGDGPAGTGGKPIELFTGAERFSFTDMVVPGPYPIEVVRSYNSQSDYDSVLGYGWALNHDRRLYEYADGSIIIRFGCGIKQRFVQGQAGSGHYEAVDSTKLRGHLQQQGDGQYVFTHIGGWQDTFDTRGRLVVRRQPNGFSQRYHYSNKKYAVVGTSPYAMNRHQPSVTSRHYRLEQVAVYLADGSASGQAIHFEYHPTTGRLQRVRDHSGRTVHYHQDETADGRTTGNLVKVEGLAGRISTYRYDDPKDTHNATFIQHSQGWASATNTYDDKDRVTEQVWGEARYVFQYNPVTHINTMTRVLKTDAGETRLTDTFHFDADGRVLKRIYADGTESAYVFNSKRRVQSSRVHPPVIYSCNRAGGCGNGSPGEDDSRSDDRPTMAYDYDEAGRRIGEKVYTTDTDTVTSEWAYNDRGQITRYQRMSSIAPETVMATAWEYDPAFQGRLIKKTERVDASTQRVTAYRYYGNGLLKAIVLPNNDELVFQYNAQHRVKTRQLYRKGQPVAETLLSVTYDAAGFVASVEEPAAGLTRLVHDARGRLLQLTNALGESEIRTFENDRLKGVELGQIVVDDTVVPGHSVLFTHDAFQRLSTVALALQNGSTQVIETRRYDSLNRLVTLLDGENRPTHLGYDEQDRLVSRQDAQFPAERWVYNSWGHLTAYTDSKGRTTSYLNDRLGRLIEQRDAAGGVTRLRYNALDAVVSLTDAEKSTTIYTWNDLGDQLTETRPTGEVMTYGYDSLRRLSTATNSRGQVKRYTYTPFGAIASREQYASATATTVIARQDWVYNTRGLLQSESDTRTGGVQYRYEHDALGRATAIDYAYLPFSYRTTLDYTAQGRIKKLERQVSEAMQVVHYQYDERGAITRANVLGRTIDLAYNKALQVAGFDYGNHLKESRLFTAVGLLKQQQFTVGTKSVLTEDLRYDANWHVKTRSSTLHGTRTYDYNLQDRLQSVTMDNTPLPGERFDPDLVGNRQGEDIVYDDSHRLISAPSIRWQYDADGNMTRRSDGLVLSYDHDNRLTGLSKTAMQANYRYDIYNRRTTKSVNGVTRYFVWEGQQLVGEYKSDGTLIKSYGYIPGELSPRVVRQQDGLYTIHLNYLQTPLFVTDSDDKMVWDMQLSAYGTATLNEDADNNGQAFSLALRFPGQYADAESGFYYNLNRYYDPVWGRYITSDPLGLVDGPNTYSYVSDNPGNLIDPEGLTQRGANTGFAIGCGIGGFFGSIGGAALGGAGGLLCGPGAAACSPAAGSTLAASGGVLGCGAGGAVGGFIGDALSNIFNQDEADECPRTGDDPLPRDKNGVPIPESDSPHTQLGTKDGSKGRYRQGREFGNNGEHIKDIDFTDHGRRDHANPHEHPIIPNPTGGTPRRGPARPLNGG